MIGGWWCGHARTRQEEEADEESDCDCDMTEPPDCVEDKIHDHESWVEWLRRRTHFAEELWKILGYDSLLIEQSWPKYDERFLEETNVNFIIQINGKKKHVIKLPKGLNKDQVKKMVLENTHIKSFLKSNNIKKIIIIPDRVANLVV